MRPPQGRYTNLPAIHYAKTNFFARCVDRGRFSSRPELSNFSYGQKYSSTPYGIRHGQVNALAEFPRSVESYTTEPDFWQVLARLADPIDGQRLVFDRPYLYCGLINIESRSGEQAEICEVDMVSFERAKSLNDADLAPRINDRLTWYSLETSRRVGPAE